MSRIIRFGLLFRFLTVVFSVLLAVVLLAVGNEKSSAAQDDAEQLLRFRVPKEVEKFSQPLQSNSTTLESNHESLYQAGAIKSEDRSVELIERHGQFYVMKVEKIMMEEEKISNSELLEFCYGINSKYCFELKRNKQGTAWLVSKVVPVTPDFKDTKQGFMLPFSFRSAIDKAISNLASVKMARYASVTSVMPGKLFELPEFVLKSVARDETNGNLLRASFSYEVTDSELKKPCRSDCMVEFDLGMHCLPTKLHQSYKIEDKEIIHDWWRKWTKIDDKNYAVKEAIDAKAVSNSVTKHLIRVRSDMKISTRDLPESDFTLSAFGFPEPPGVEWKKPFPWYLVLAGIGTACLGAFFFLRSRARRLGGAA